mgnify:CR=1 FL=1
MTLKKILLSIVCLDFVALTGYVLYLYGPVGWLEPLVSNWAGRLVVFDLLIALSCAVWWMVRDARAAGRNPWPYVLLTLTTGAAGPLIYLILAPAPRRLAKPDPVRALAAG